MYKVFLSTFELEKFLMFYQVKWVCGKVNTVQAATPKEALIAAGVSDKLLHLVDVVEKVKIPATGWNPEPAFQVQGPKGMRVEKFLHPSCTGLLKTFVNGKFSCYQLAADFL